MATLATPQQGQNTDIDTSAEVLTADTIVPTYGISIKALDANTGLVYVNWLTTATTSNGWELAKGQEVFISRAECVDANAVSVIGSAANQAVCWRVF